MVDFYATWCGPFKALAPIGEKLAGEFNGRLKVGKLNIDESPVTPGQFAVRAVPTLVFFKGGKAVDTVVGLKKETELRSRIEQLLNCWPPWPARRRGVLGASIRPRSTRTSSRSSKACSRIAPTRSPGWRPRRPS